MSELHEEKVRSILSALSDNALRLSKGTNKYFTMSVEYDIVNDFHLKYLRI